MKSAEPSWFTAMATKKEGVFNPVTRAPEAVLVLLECLLSL
jgi:hypothetical protein